MKLPLRLALLLAIVLPTASAEDPRLAASRELATRYQQQLGQRLQAALAEGGPVHAITVCREDAPRIAAELSRSSGARVARTALRTRNPANAPDADARAMLQDFAIRMQPGAVPPEHYESSADGSARYLRAIGTQPPCLLCHGAALSTEMRTALAALYPEDRATGFLAGELRGAFVIDWPASSMESHP